MDLQHGPTNLYIRRPSISMGLQVKKPPEKIWAWTVTLLVHL